MPEGNLHEYAVQAEGNLEKLATGLAQAGASPETVKAVEQMADVTRQIVAALGKGQEETGDEEPPAEQEQPRTMDQAANETSQMMQDSAAKRQ
jgi:hypothetical protein